MKIRFHLFLLAAMCLTLSACDFGEVDQGRCVAYNENTGKFTMILDVNHDQFNPQYTGGAYEYQTRRNADLHPKPAAASISISRRSRLLSTITASSKNWPSNSPTSRATSCPTTRR